MIGLLESYRRQVKGGLMIEGGVDPIAHCALGLTGEAGEVADAIKKSQYNTPRPFTKEKARDELGDVLWYLVALADKMGLSLEEILIGNIEKLEARHGSQRYSIETLWQQAGIMDEHAKSGVPPWKLAREGVENAHAGLKL